MNKSSSSGENLHCLFKSQESDKNKKSEQFSVYVGMLSEEAKNYTLGYEQSKISDHSYQFNRNGQQLTHYHRNVTEKKSKGKVKVFFLLSHFTL